MNCTKEQVFNLSSFCTDLSKSDAELQEKSCFPDESGYNNAVEIYIIINAVVGFCGNLLTLLAIPFATKRKK